MPKSWSGEAAQRAARTLAAQRLPCWLCGQPINYDLPFDDPMAFSLDHAEPKSKRPDLMWEPTNHRASHSQCNKRRGNRRPPLTIGTPTATW